MEYSDYLRSKLEALVGPGRIRALEASLPPALRVNTLKIETGELLERLEEKGFELERVPWTKFGFWIKRAPFSPGATPEYLMGYYYLQDPASMYACEVLDPQEGELVLDMAAAPGGKTSYISQLMKNRGTVVAVDVNRERMAKLRSNLTRLGVRNVVAVRTDAALVGGFGLTFDRVMLDAPCTGTGTIHKNPEVRFKEATDVERCTSLQLTLLRSGLEVLRPGGVLVYCTCSYLPEENEAVVEEAINLGAVVEEIEQGLPGLTAFGSRNFDPQVSRARRFYPFSHGCQGFFLARLRKLQ
jgi:NOL1/NOP2/sun family putative RNA methylase